MNHIRNCDRCMQQERSITMSCSSISLEELTHGIPDLEFAKVYSEMSDVQKEHGKQLIEQLSIEKSVKVLDLGCGTGYLSALLADCVGPEGEVVAVDPSKARLMLARKQYSRPNMVFLEANDMTFPEDQYNLVFANHVLHWIEDKLTLMDKVYRNLKPGGQFAFVVPERSSKTLDKMVDLMGPETAKAMKEDHHWMSASEYIRLATSVGFRVRISKVEDKPFYFANVEALLKWFSGSTEGRFEPEKVNQAELEEFKKQFGDGPASVDLLKLTLILTKP